MIVNGEIGPGTSLEPPIQYALVITQGNAVVFQTNGTARQDTASKDLRFREQTEEAVSSVCRNLPEGFVRFQPGEFASFVRYSQASLAELGEQLTDGVARKYWTDEEVEPARVLTRRTAGALGGLRRYLKSEQARRNAKAIADRCRTEGTKRTEGTVGTREPKEPEEP